jgi:hypothetical protein
MLFMLRDTDNEVEDIDDKETSKNVVVGLKYLGSICQNAFKSLTLQDVFGEDKSAMKENINKVEQSHSQICVTNIN